MGIQKNKPYNLTASTNSVRAGECWLEGMYVNSTSSGVIHLYNGTSTAVQLGSTLGGDITPGAGYHYLGNLHATAGLSVQLVSGTINVTLHIREED